MLCDGSYSISDELLGVEAETYEIDSIVKLDIKDDCLRIDRVLLEIVFLFFVPNVNNDVSSAFFDLIKIIQVVYV